MSTSNRTHPNDSVEERTPLLGGGSGEATSATTRPTDIEAQNGDNEETSAATPSSWTSYWTDIQILTSWSLTFCGLIILDGFIFYVCTEILNVDNYIPWRLRGYLETGNYICFWTAIISVLNYSRLRRDNTQLPWSLNLIIDFLVSISSFFVSLLFFLTLALRPCDNGYYGRPPNCITNQLVVLVVGSVEMGFVLLLGLTHVMLLIMRIRVPPQQGSSSGNSGSSSSGGTRSTFSPFSDGWFVGMGRGPLNVAVQSMPPNRSAE